MTSTESLFQAVDTWSAKNGDSSEVRMLGKTGVQVVEGGREFFVDSEWASEPARISLFVDEVFEIEDGRRRALDPEETVRVCRLAIQGLVALGQRVDVLPASLRAHYE